MTRAKRSTSTANANGSRHKTRLRQQASITSWLSNLQIKNDANQDNAAASVESLSVAAHHHSPAPHLKEEDTDEMEDVIQEQQQAASDDEDDEDDNDQDSNYSSDDQTVKTDAQTARLSQEDNGDGKCVYVLIYSVAMHSLIMCVCL